MSEKRFYPGSKTNICIDCKNACGGCSWADKFEPVPGWTATPSVVHLSGKGRQECQTWHITACPMFEEG